MLLACKILYLSLLSTAFAKKLQFGDEPYDIGDVVKVIEFKDGPHWINDGKSHNRILGTAIQFRWVLTSAKCFVLESKGVWDFPTKVRDLDNVRILSLDKGFKILNVYENEVSRLVIHPNYKLNRTTVYNAALLETKTPLTRTSIMYYFEPWNFNKLEKAYIVGIHGPKVERIDVLMDHSLHNCPCFNKKQAYKAICLFDLFRKPYECHLINGSPVLLDKGGLRGVMVGFTDAYYKVHECVYTSFGTERSCSTRSVFFSAIAICPLHGFINMTLGRDVQDNYKCVTSNNLPSIILIPLSVTIFIIIK